MGGARGRDRGTKVNSRYGVDTSVVVVSGEIRVAKELLACKVGGVNLLKPTQAGSFLSTRKQRHR